MVITGYDDEVTIDGQQGVFILRNSWGPNAGDHGDFYMTYDYFQMLILGVTVIGG